MLHACITRQKAIEKATRKTEGVMRANCMKRKDLSILLACLLFVARSTCKVHGAICTRVSPSVAESMMVLFAFGVYLARSLARSLGLVCMTDLLTAPCLLSLFDLFRLSAQHGQKDRESHVLDFAAW